MTIPPSLAQPSISQAPLEELDPNAINKSIIDAKGDLVTGTANDTPARLPVGTDGQVLLADSSTTTGLKWATDPTTDIVTTKGDMLVATGPDTLVRLPVGSNNQVLVADSSTTEGVKWSSETDPNSINKSIIDAKGDLVVGTANDTPARLPIGTNGQYLVANSSATEGMAWTTPNIALGTETSGDYVQSVSGGTGVTVTGGTGEGSTPSIAIGQAVGTGDTVAFGGLNVDSGTLYVDSTNNRVGINDTTPSYSLDVTGDGHFTTDLTVDGTLTAPHIHGNLAGSIYYHVKNVSGGTLTAGTPVYVSGTVGSTQVAEVQAARADTASKMPAIGIVETDIANNANGHVVVIGAVQNLNTNAYALNEVLYVGATGGLTNTRPTGASDIVQVMGTVGRVNTNTGEVIVLTYDQLRAPNTISIPGNITTTAGHFTGDGSGLTNVPAGALSGTISSTNIGNDSVALGTKTTGDYVQTLSAGTGVTVTGGTGEGSTPSVAIGQAVAITSSPQFAGLTTTGTANLNAASVTGSLSANSLSATTSVTGATLTINGTQIDPTGATSNQVLAYNGTKFAPSTPSADIPLSTVTTKGDIIAATGSAAVSRLGVGSNNQVLTADSSTVTGLKWATPSADVPLSTVTTKGDLIVATANATVARQAVGGNGTFIVADSAQTNGIKWTNTITPVAGTNGLSIESPTSQTADNLIIKQGTSGQSGYLFSIANWTSSNNSHVRSLYVSANGSELALTGNRFYQGSPIFNYIGGIPFISLYGSSSGANVDPYIQFYRIVQNNSSGDAIGSFRFFGRSTNNNEAARISAHVDATPGSADMPGRLSFWTTSDGTTTLSERMRITSAKSENARFIQFYADTQVQTGNFFVHNGYQTFGAPTQFYGDLFYGVIQIMPGIIAPGFFGTTMGIYMYPTIDGTTHYGYHSSGQTSFNAGTVDALYLFAGFDVLENTKTIVNQVGFYCGDLTSANTNYGIQTTISSGTNKYNLYISGTAANYLAGRFGVGATLTSGAMAQVTNTTAADIGLIVKGATSQSGNLQEWQDSGSVVLAKVDSAGKLTVKSLEAPLIQNAQTGTTYTLALTDADKLVELDNTSAITLTIPLNSSVAFPTGTKINILQTNTGQVTVSPASGVTMNSASSKTKLTGRWSAATLIKRATDTWVLIGDIAT